MESLEPWMVIGLLCIIHALMAVLWLMEWKKSPQTILEQLVVDHRTHAEESVVKESLLQKWLRRLTTM
jgi:hypothetical protein